KRIRTMTFVATTVLAFYLVIALFSLYMTHQERRWNQQVDPLYGSLGYVLCVVWPVTVMLFALTMMLQRRSA
ncbi:MAG: hypothetical protein ACK4RZ_17850, partial [Paracoccaceae bacterium]